MPTLGEAAARVVAIYSGGVTAGRQDGEAVAGRASATTSSRRRLALAAPPPAAPPPGSTRETLRAAALAGVTEPERLGQIGDWIIECTTAADLIARVLDEGRLDG